MMCVQLSPSSNTLVLVTGGQAGCPKEIPAKGTTMKAQQANILSGNTKFCLEEEET
jgi:hypothetical protein